MNYKDFWIGYTLLWVSLGLLWLLPSTIGLGNEAGVTLIGLVAFICSMFGAIGIYQSKFWRADKKDKTNAAKPR